MSKKNDFSDETDVFFYGALTITSFGGNLLAEAGELGCRECKHVGCNSRITPADGLEILF